MENGPRIEKIKEKISGLKQQISECRKKGFDMKIAELKLMGASSRVIIAEATLEENDINQAEQLTEEVRSEMEEAKKADDQDKSFELIRDIIKNAQDLITQDKIKEAKDSYLKCAELYKALDAERKKLIYQEVNLLRRSIR